ncbi:MAG TPA: MaoC/PaaZ C-terminal domain-containing protein [Woeseiaceae bacterium]|nr:MaoC/PaaZ C-terminal domain-containing protein [Woeseiaceae bacterium]
MTGKADTLVLEKVFTQADFDAFAELSGDDNPIHVDEAFSSMTRFGRTVSHGMLLATVLRGMLDRLVPGARQVEQKLMFPSPTYAGDAMRFAVVRRSDDGRHVVADVSCERIDDGVITCAGEATLLRAESR